MPRPTIKPRAIPPKTSKASAYKTIGRTSDGVYVLKPMPATSSPTELGKKVARLMAAGQVTRTASSDPLAATTKTSSKKVQRVEPK